MDTLKVCISWIVSAAQCLESCLHQCAYTAKPCRRKVCLCLFLKSVSRSPALAPPIARPYAKCTIQCFSCVILLYCYQTRHPPDIHFLLYVGAFGAIIANIICRRYDLSEMDRKTMCKHQHVSFFRFGFNIILYIAACFHHWSESWSSFHTSAVNTSNPVLLLLPRICCLQIKSDDVASDSFKFNACACPFLIR